MKRKKVLVYTNDIWTYIASCSSKNDYYDGLAVLKKEYSECNDIEESEITEEMITEWVFHLIDEDYDLLHDNLSSSENNKSCIITGTLGLWNGRPDIVPERCANVSKAISKIFNANYDHYTTIYKVNGHLEISQSHHDGTNYFVIHLLNEKGIRAYENLDYNGKADISNPCYHKAMTKYLY